MPLPLTDFSCSYAFFRCETVIKTDLSLPGRVSRGRGYSLASRSHSFTLAYSLIHWLPHILIHSLTHSLILTQCAPQTLFLPTPRWFLVTSWLDYSQHAPQSLTQLSPAESISTHALLHLHGELPSPVAPHHLMSSSLQAWDGSLTATMDNCSSHTCTHVHMHAFIPHYNLN